MSAYLHVFQRQVTRNTLVSESATAQRPTVAVDADSSLVLPDARRTAPPSNRERPPAAATSPHRSRPHAPRSTRDAADLALPVAPLAATAVPAFPALWGALASGLPAHPRALARPVTGV